MNFINLTPHPIALNDGRVFSNIIIGHTPEGKPIVQAARVAATFSEPNELGIVTQKFGEITDLPEPQDGVMYVVSLLVLDAAKAVGRKDCVAPASGHPLTIRNEQGHIVSVPYFVV
jgi:hypothetical protein